MIQSIEPAGPGYNRPFRNSGYQAVDANALRLITVDLDETVWPCAVVIDAAEQAMQQCLSRIAGRLTEVHDLDSLRHHRRALMRQRPAIAHDVTAVRRASLAELLDQVGYPETVADQAMAVFLESRNRIEPFADAAAGLQVLREHHCLISLTNGNSDPELTPLRGLFHHSLTAADAGAAKPSPELFEMAMTLADARPEQTLHIGDDPLLDVDAARRLGLGTVWVNRSGQQWPAELEPPMAEVADLHQLLVWLGVGRDRG